MEKEKPKAGAPEAVEDAPDGIALAPTTTNEPDDGDEVN